MEIQEEQDFSGSAGNVPGEKSNLAGPADVNPAAVAPATGGRYSLISRAMARAIAVKMY